MAESLTGGTASDISSLAAKDVTVDSDVSSLANAITTNDVFAISQVLNSDSAFVTVDYSAAGFATAPSVVGTMMSTNANDPIMGVQLSGSPTTSAATFVFSDELPSANYKIEVLAAV